MADDVFAGRAAALQHVFDQVDAAARRIEFIAEQRVGHAHAALERVADGRVHEGLERLREIVSNLRDFQHPRVRGALVALLASRSNEIRFFALDGLSGYPAEEIAPHFAARLLDPDESQRVKQLALELLVDKEISMAAWADALVPVLPPMYRLDPAGLVQRK